MNRDTTKKSVLLTRENVSSYSPWPTPVANDDNKTPEAHLAMKKRMGERDGTFANRTAITSLNVKVKDWSQRNLPKNIGQRWSTPRASDGEKGSPNQKFSTGNVPLASQAYHFSHPARPTLPPGEKSSDTTTVSRLLNPKFISWLMGWPTTAPITSDFSATEWSHFKQHMRSALCGLLCAVPDPFFRN